MKNKWFQFIVIGILCLLGAGAGWFSRIAYTNAQPSKLVEVRENTGEYRYINPLLYVDSPRKAPELNDLRSSIEKIIGDAKNNNSANSVSVYFRDVNSGKWTGVDEDTVYDPSSMLKVAVMIGYLDKADNDPSILTKQLPYTAAVDPGQYYKPVHPLQSGTYSVRELIEAMIIDSDNIALNALYNNDRSSFVDVLKALQIPPPPSVTTLDFISPRDYSSLFRTLYSATYLSKNTSEQTLQLLSYTNFKNGLVAGVPQGTIVAHKFGEHTTLKNGLVVESRELHDCGIVYYPRRPYFLCVMTKGTDFPKLESVISSISKTVYAKVLDL